MKKLRRLLIGLFLGILICSLLPAIPVSATAIDIGADAINRSVTTSVAFTYIDKTNPANASGTITTVEIWAYTPLVGCIVGTFYKTNGYTLKCRDSVAIGNVASGSKQTFSELSIAVEVGDYIGFYSTSGQVERDSSGFGGNYRLVGEYIDPGDEATYNLVDDDGFSVYGIGAGAGADPTVTTQDVSDITATTATGNGNITNTGEDVTCDKRGIVYGTTSQGNPGNVAPGVSGYDDYEEETNGFGTGAFTRGLTGLDSGQLYYVRAYAHNVSGGYAYGSEVSFSALVGVPAITSNAATYVAQTTARLNSTVTDDGGEDCDVRFGYGDETQTAGNFTSYDTVTDWVEDEYETGGHPYVDVEGLTPNDEYFFRVQIKNSETTLVTSGELTFNTETDFSAPTNLKAYPESESVGLTWTKGIGATYTMIRYSETDYPADETEGALAYLGPLANYSLTGLTSGRTYYIVAISKSGAEYSATVEVMATTGTAEAAAAEPGAPDEPTGLFQGPDPTQIENFPGYAMFNGIAEDLNIPLDTLWMYIILLGVGLIGFLFYKISHDIIVVMVVITIGIAWGSLIGILPLWMMILTIILGLGLFQFQQRRA